MPLYTIAHTQMGSGQLILASSPFVGGSKHGIRTVCTEQGMIVCTEHFGLYTVYNFIPIPSLTPASSIR
ncbi:hypothetical protein, partial [Pontibacter sp. 13R65]|uniref:hypothetical protein n=1 Tax=Pontibacter sp. 13R65 TaxID=3127458 RepID=UPI00301C6FD1